MKIIKYLLYINKLNKKKLKYLDKTFLKIFIENHMPHIYRSSKLLNFYDDRKLL